MKSGFNNKKNKIYTFIFPLILLFGSFFVANSASAISGIYTSSVYDIGSTGKDITNVTWIKAGVGTVTVELRTGALNPPTDGSWTVITSGGNPGVALDGNRYAQYRVTFNNVNYSTTVDDVNSAITSFWLTYVDVYPSPQTLTSSDYDATSWDSKIASVSWNEVVSPVGSNVRLYIETASTQAGLTGAGWQEITACSAGPNVTCTGVPAAFQTGNDDKWFRYRIDLYSGSGLFPEVDNIQITYDANLETPSLDRVDISMASSYAPAGSFESGVYDTIANQQFNAMTIVQNIAGGSIVTRARSCNNPDCSDGDAWGGCSPLSTGSDITGGCVIDGERYIQYRLELDRGGDIATTPWTDSITINFDQLQVYLPGADFEIVAQVSEPDSSLLINPIAKVYNSSAVQVGPDYTMYDDATHGDDIVGNGVYGTAAINFAIEDIYTIEIEETNSVGLTGILAPVGYFAIVP